MLLAGTAISYLVSPQKARREIAALAKEATGGRWQDGATLSQISSVILRAEQAQVRGG